MPMTLDQARALDAVARLGSYAKAGEELRRAHTAVMHAVRQVEAAVGLAVVERGGYRAALTAVGQRVLEYARRMLEVERELAGYCEVARLGYEPTLGVVYDGLLPAQPILAAVRAAHEVSPATRLALFSEFLGEVEARAQAEAADILVAVVPLERSLAHAVPLAPLPSVLVVKKGHPLARARAVSPEMLAAYPFLTVRGSDKRLRMSTSELEKPSALLLSDFQAKKVALLEGMGWGWMPEYLVADELAAGRLALVRWGEGRHVFVPVMHLRVRPEELGPAARAFSGAVSAAMRGGRRGSR